MIDIFKNSEEKVAIYIDGSNFYNYLKDKEIGFSKGVKFDYKAFVDSLVGRDRVCASKRYYTGVFSDDGSGRSKDLVRGQQKFFTNIKKDGFTIKRGRIMPLNKIYKEKGTGCQNCCRFNHRSH